MMRRLSPTIFLFLFSLLSLYSTGQQSSRSNPCGVTAVINPGGDSVLSVPTVILFTSASINASSYQFIIDSSPFPVNTLVNYSINSGITQIKLVASGGGCSDTAISYYFYPGTFPPDTNNTKMYYGTPAVNEYVTNFIPVSNGGFLIAGDRTNNSFQNLPQRGFLMKTKPSGCIEWAMLIDSSRYLQTSTVADNIAECTDGTYFVSGKSESNIAFLMKVTSGGTVSWSKNLTSPTITPLQISGLKAMPDGGLIITAYVWGNGFYILRMDTNGNIIWQREFARGGTFVSNSLRNILLKDGYIYAGGYINYFESNVNYGTSVLLKLDYSTGQPVWTQRYYAPAAEIVIRDMHPSGSQLLINSLTGPGTPGNYLLSTFIKAGTDGIISEAISIEEPDEYYPSRSQLVPLPGKKFYLLSAGIKPLPLQPYISYQTKLAKLDSAFNIIWAKHHGAIQLGQYFYPGYDSDESLVMAGNETGTLNAYYTSLSAKIVVRKIDSSGIEPSTSCVLYPQPMTKTVIPILQEPFAWTTDAPALLTSVSYPVLHYSIYPELRYKCPDYIDSCSFFKLTGPSAVCNLSYTYTYKVHKNKGCGQPVQWVIPSGVQVVLQTDTAITVRFSAFGNYTIAGILPFGCTPLKDSVRVLAASNTPPVQLGADTSLCPNNSIILHAGPSYLSYLWQNGNTDSVLTAGTPGIYWVEVSDSCGNISRDSVVISASALVALSIGPDRNMCAGDTIHLDAPPGFLQYAWSPNYQISATAGQHVVVSPSVDTAYSVMAEKTPGCFGFDTVRIRVNRPPLIQLGADKSFCNGDSAVLNAGPGFTGYQWSTGQTTQLISVFTVGNYTVTGITAEGCKSSDTLRVNSVFPLPQPNLTDDTTLCTGTSRLLDAGTGYTSYQWNTGHTTASISVNGPGVYFVTVTDINNCRGSDTARIRTILPLPSGFLPADTAICNYGDIQLKAAPGFTSYRWNTGSTQSFLTITQPGWYWVQVQDKNSCRGIDSILVRPKECIRGFYMPTGFTPGNDGKNDLLKPFLFGVVKQYQFQVYNRWGQKVFETSDLSKGWDGRFNNVVQDGNVFIWICRYQLEGESVMLKKGSVVLIR
ncbi:MAG: gliding motility-associated C-terminal domain-containing protein [Bacteroidetes bacterium]|nr:gliding motility-associated C-terminal domain-containing protein [Bacteroidota bacterium]